MLVLFQGFIDILNEEQHVLGENDLVLGNVLLHLEVLAEVQNDARPQVDLEQRFIVQDVDVGGHGLPGILWYGG